MSLIDLNQASEKDFRSEGVVYINETPDIRTGKRGEFMVGMLMSKDRTIEFKIWEPSIFECIKEHGLGAYRVRAIGSFFNKEYLTINSVQREDQEKYQKANFLPRIKVDILKEHWAKAKSDLLEAGVSQQCFELASEMINSPAIAGRFTLEGAAIRHHDNLIGGLFFHTTKMLQILHALLLNNQELKDNADLLCLGIIVHDIGKVYEYDDLSAAEFWYANHRIRGIEFISDYKDSIISIYNEEFYRQLQSIIAGHHGDYGDRPSTVAAAIVHFIDSLESQTTGLLQESKNASNQKIRYSEWGFLQTLPKNEQQND